jgi:hypothetical protein
VAAFTEGKGWKRLSAEQLFSAMNKLAIAILAYGERGTRLGSGPPFELREQTLKWSTARQQLDSSGGQRWIPVQNGEFARKLIESGP